MHRSRRRPTCVTADRSLIPETGFVDVGPIGEWLQGGQQRAVGRPVRGSVHGVSSHLDIAANDDNEDAVVPGGRRRGPSVSPV